MDKATYDRGLEIRKSVLGNEFVDKAIASADEFNRPMQDLTTEYCWGYVWGRDGLTRKTRSFLNLAMLCALNRPHELKTHVRGALANGAPVRDPRGLHAGRDLLRCAGGRGCVPERQGSLRRARQEITERGCDEGQMGTRDRRDRGLGLAVAEGFAGAGANIVLHDLVPPKQAADDLRTRFGVESSWRASIYPSAKRSRP